jgi:hypothetical protein
MNKEQYGALLGKLNSLLDIDGTGPSVSPKQSGGGKLPLPDGFRITAGTDIEALTTPEAYLVHTLLHKFYSVGNNKFLTNQDIVELHEKIKLKINHSEYDKLDRQ